MDPLEAALAAGLANNAPFTESMPKSSTKKRKRSQSHTSLVLRDGSRKDFEEKDDAFNKTAKRYEENLFNDKLALPDENFQVKEIGIRLLARAAQQRWEPQELGRLAKVILEECAMSRHKAYKYLKKYTPEFVSSEFLEGLDFHFKPKWIITLIQRASLSKTEVMQRIVAFIEAEHLSLDDDGTLDGLVGISDEVWEEEEIITYAIKLCECTRTVGGCVRILKAFTEHWNTDKVARFVNEIVRLEFFRDLEGDRTLVFQEFPEVRTLLPRAMMEVDSDADDEGNLKGFIVADSESTESSDEDEHESLTSNRESANEIVSTDENALSSESDEALEDTDKNVWRIAKKLPTTHFTSSKGGTSSRFANKTATKNTNQKDRSSTAKKELGRAKARRRVLEDGDSD